MKTRNPPLKAALLAFAKSLDIAGMPGASLTLRQIVSDYLL